MEDYTIVEKYQQAKKQTVAIRPFFNPNKEKVAIMRVAVQRINLAIEQKLLEENLTYNAGLNDFLFARRVYVDLTGTIPSY